MIRPSVYGQAIIILAQDLIWAERLVRAVRDADGRPSRVASKDALATALEAAEPDPRFVIVDLTAHAYDAFAAKQTPEFQGD